MNNSSHFLNLLPTLLSCNFFLSLKVIGIKEMFDHILNIRDIMAQPKALEVTMFDSFLVNYIFCIS